MSKFIEKAQVLVSKDPWFVADSAANFGIFLLKDHSWQLSASALYLSLKLALAPFIKEKFEERQKELIEHVDIAKATVCMKDSPQLRDLIINVLQRIWDESASAKREIYYKYINNVVDKRLHDVNESRILYVVSIIDIWEIELLKIISDCYGEALALVIKKEESQAKKKDEVEDSSRERPISLQEVFDNWDRGLFLSDMQEVVEINNKYDTESLIEGLQMLSNYGVIVEHTGLFGGTSYGPVTKLGKNVLKRVM